LRVLITGGAGFIGQHLAKSLLEQSHVVRVIDNLTPQVHGESPDVSSILAPEVEFIRGDVRDSDALRKALQGIEVVYHLAAQTGVGQSMYMIDEYMDCNVMGTARLMTLLADDRGSVERVVVASSRAVYGEGKYSCESCGFVFPEPRSPEQMDRGEWEVKCPTCSHELVPEPTDEDKPLKPGSIYAITKRDQEETCLCIGQAYGIPTTAFRFFNVYGSGQALGNPYTGIITIFAAKIRNGEAPLIYEDGLESRDFVHVSDVVQALTLAMRNPNADYQVMNVGSGEALTVLDMARVMIREMNAGPLEPAVIGKYRVGDIRHCHADLTRIGSLLGYSPGMSFDDGIKEFLAWAEGRESEDRLETATSELGRRGLFR
jgi:dTDP-L-rhamnose 4-epimerase